MTARRIGGVAAAMIAGTIALRAAPQTAPDLRALYDAHRWFALRDALAKGQPPLFYRGVVEAVFNDTANAERDLKVVIQSDAGGHDEVEGRRQLLTLAFRNGRYLAADQQLERLLELTPDAADLIDDAPLVRTLAQTPDQEIVERRQTSGRLDVAGGHVLLPVKVNGQPAEFIFDPASNVSGVSESEAVRLGLDVRAVDASVGGTAGSGAPLRVAAGVPFVVGNIRLANVAFVVWPDSRPPLIDLPAGKRGVIGLSVLLAMNTLRWRAADRTFEAAFESGGFDVTQATVVFDDVFPLRRSGFRATTKVSAGETTLDFGRMIVTSK